MLKTMTEADLRELYIRLCLRGTWRLIQDGHLDPAPESAEQYQTSLRTSLAELSLQELEASADAFRCGGAWDRRICQLK